MSGSVYFDEASWRAIDLAGEFVSEGFDLVVVRDVLGRLSVVVDDRSMDVAEATVQEWSRELRGALGAHAGGRGVIRASSMMRPDVVESSRARMISLPAEGRGALRFLENTVVGADWSTVEPPVESVEIPRVALYGFKGGVGRSTATALLARHLAERGETVLVVDLDLESPGVSSLLVRTERLPIHGVVDHLVEQAVGAQDGLDLVVRSDIVPGHGRGSVWIAPARGAGLEASDWGNDYVAKLNRVYGSNGEKSFADKLVAAVDAAVESVAVKGGRTPTVVLLDSRAGIHDIAAVVIATMANLTLMFATNDAQTWLGYRDLFENWVRVGQAHNISEKLKAVAVRVPSSPRDKKEYLERFVENSLEAFSVLYGEISPGDPRGDVPADDDFQAPHWPIAMHYAPDLLNLDPEDTTWRENTLILAAFKEFLDETTAIIRLLAGGE